VSDSKKVKANKPKETGSQEKPDLMRELFLGTGPMICITKSSKCMIVRSGRRGISNIPPRHPRFYQN
jgi:hypothetical protein